MSLFFFAILIKVLGMMVNAFQKSPVDSAPFNRTKQGNSQGQTQKYFQNRQNLFRGKVQGTFIQVNENIKEP